MEELLTFLHSLGNKIQSEDTDFDLSREKPSDMSVMEVQEQHGRYKSMYPGPSVKLNSTLHITIVFKDSW